MPITTNRKIFIEIPQTRRVLLDISLWVNEEKDLISRQSISGKEQQHQDSLGNILKRGCRSIEKQVFQILGLSKSFQVSQTLDELSVIWT